MMPLALPLRDPGPAAASPFEVATARQARRVRLVLAGLGALLVAGALLSVAVGAVGLRPAQLAGILLARSGLGPAVPAGAAAFTAQEASVLLAIRLPRVLLSVVVGAGLAVSGAVMQGLFRNPLADPGLVGVSSGSALGAATAIVLGAMIGVPASGALGPVLVATAAFAGGLATAFVVYRIATARGRTSVTTMLLAGIAVNALCGAGVGALVLFADDGQLRDLTFWTLGSLGGATWGSLAIAAPLVGAAVVAAPWLARALDALLLGEAEARHLGVRTERVKGIAVTLAALAVAAATAVAGLIGFVGLVAPHLVRLLLGPGHRALLPASALAGAVLLVFADLAGRTVLAPVEVPIGIVTAVAGAPFFLALLMRERPDG
ncbi:MAG TPA: iron ABC transporter permease [Rubricoccaceae bacterium]|jgi:iron complex transport system permease protein